MENLFKDLIEVAKTDRKLLNKLKNISVEGKQYELASQLREIERDTFPETEENKLAKEQAEKLSTVFRMVDLNVSEETCWLISETVKIYNEKKGEFSLQDATSIKTKKQAIYF